VQVNRTHLKWEVRSSPLTEASSSLTYRTVGVPAAAVDTLVSAQKHRGETRVRLRPCCVVVELRSFLLCCCCLLLRAPAADLHGLQDPGLREMLDAVRTPFVCARGPEKPGTRAAGVISTDLVTRLLSQPGVERLRHCLVSNIVELMSICRAVGRQCETLC
jgi:hypothetical protein